MNIECYVINGRSKCHDVCAFSSNFRYHWQIIKHQMVAECAMKSRFGTLYGKVCLVTGTSRGIGKGIALQLGDAGAIVYITARTLLPNEYSEGSLVETAEEVELRGGRCIPVKCDHANDEDVKQLFNRIKEEQNGRLDVLVNNAYEGTWDIFDNLNVPFWELPPEFWDNTCNVGLRSHYVASVLASEMMVAARQGLIVNISSGGGLGYIFNASYGIGKSAVDRMAADCAVELRPYNVAFVSLWPGAVKTELLSEIVHSYKPGINDVRLVRMVEQGESPEFAGKAIIHLATDRNIMKKSGRILWTSDLANEYCYTDVDGVPPPNFRSLKVFLSITGHTWLAAITPSFIKCPFWILAVMTHKF
ncbi:dehydrogenase/reductase SDR family member 1-like [Amphiura filiformis]|uniref:dehydrogenase/reductase SDR family member 1-like n=1 Tax=Amphiura filiformis TaxID=82378 RepID=UPI003B21D164